MRTVQERNVILQTLTCLKWRSKIRKCYSTQHNSFFPSWNLAAFFLLHCKFPQIWVVEETNMVCQTQICFTNQNVTQLNSTAFFSLETWSKLHFSCCNPAPLRLHLPHVPTHKYHLPNRQIWFLSNRQSWFFQQTNMIFVQQTNINCSRNQAPFGLHLPHHKCFFHSI